MAGHLEILLGAATAGAEGPGRRLSELPLLSPPERAQLLVEWSGGEAAYPREASLYSLFAGQAALRPDAVALVAEGPCPESVSYGGLAARAEGLARRLLGLGVTPGTRVGLCLDRSAERVMATLAILAAGAAYVPLDPSYPRERLDFLVRDSAAPLLLTMERLLPSLPEAGAVVVCLDRPASPALAALAPVAAAGPPLPRVPAEALAYVMYTSGSTGVPKGVAVPQRGVVRLVRGTGYARFGPGESLLQLAPYAFDAATLELWAALLHGGRAVMPPPGALSLAELEALVLRHGVSTLHLTAGLFHQAVDAGLSGFAGLSQLLAGGDALSAPHVARAAAELPGTRVLCCYGPTENTTFTAVHPADGPLPAGTAPLGRPIANTWVHVLDRDLGPAPLGVPGELYAGGDGLAWGYLGRPDLTAERFLPNPCPRAAGERLYRTGDLARWRPGGWLEFLGRTDAQVKVRGFRVEPGEVEAALRTHPRVREAVVLVRGEAGEDRRLVAYVVAEEQESKSKEDGAADLPAYLRGRLPEHMVPAVFVLLPALPLTGHGKVDRRALARIVPAAGETRPPRAGGAPRTEVEALLAGIWAEVLGVGRVGIEDDFFALGGHSLLATQVVSRLRQALGVELPLRRFFAAPTVAGLAREVAALVAAAGRGAAVAGAGRRVPDPKEPLPLSFAQERLWFLDQLEPGSAAYNLPTALRLAGRLDPAVLAASLGRIVARHEALRTTFRAGLEGPYQAIAPALRLDLPGVDLGGLPDRAREAELARLAGEESRRPFDLAAGPLVRAALLRLAAEAHVLFLTFHHIVADAWSMGVLVRELGELYGKLAAGRPPRLPELPIQYADHALWQRRRLAGEALEREIAHWRQALAGLEPLDLPLDRPRPVRRRGRGGLHRFALGPRLAAALGRLAREEGATLFMTLLAGLSALLARYAGQEDVAVGSAVANRTHRESEPLIGFFVNTLVLRADLAGDPGFRQALGRARQTALAAYAHQDLPFEKLVLALSPERDTSRTPLFQVFFALQNTPMEPLDLPGLRLEPMEMPAETAKFDLALTLGETAEGLSGAWSYDRDLFDATTVGRLNAHFERLLEAAVAQPDLPFWNLPLSSEAEREQLREWNDVPGTPAPAGCLHERFWAQAGRTPDAVALVWGGERLSQGALRERAARAARRLRRLGVGPEVRVGVFARRGPDLVAALLGVLAAGGAYVPLDPEYPAERLGFMLADSGASLVLAGPGLAERLPPGAAPRLLDLGELWAPETRDDPGPSWSGVSPANLAYVIYTSGSTGRPKGVAIAHRSAAARIGWAAGAFGEGELDGVLAATSICFDLSVFELFVPLSWGGRVILADNALALADLPGAWEVTLVNTVPSAMAELVRAGRVPGSVATVNLAGEPLPRSLAEGVYGAGVGRVSNLYGPSEDTTYSTVERVERGGRGEPAVGRPLAGSPAWVVDRRGGLAPLGVPGELWLGGAGLARGYLDRPDLTAERFVPDPWGEVPGARLYRTGDRARFGMDGRLHFLGRLDRQVKVRGFRIELGELEAVLAAHPRVREAVVLARQDSPEEVRLVAYVVASPAPAGRGEEPAPPESPGLPEQLRAHLADLLPSHMIPAAFVLLAALPLSPTGKVDRRALPAPEWRPEPGGIPPRTPLEEVIAGLFAEVLGVERVGVRDSFFHLGGHSLKAVQLASRLRAIFKVELPVRSLFETPTVEALATAVAAGEPRPGQSEKLARVLLRVKQGSLPRR
ncbi:MAG: hypothetical protein QOJ16_2537, partial [Acidobacteriota bacterium]|nr:hypothetical protein [Acidobacteriota bacterium]